MLYRMVGRGAFWTEEEINAMADFLAQTVRRIPTPKRQLSKARDSHEKPRRAVGHEHDFAPGLCPASRGDGCYSRGRELGRRRRDRAGPGRRRRPEAIQVFTGTGGEHFAEQLIASGVKYIFGNSASEDAHFYEALVDRPQLQVHPHAA